MEMWYVLDESALPPQPMGPYSYEDLRELCAAGRVLPSSRVARPGEAAWTEAADDPVLAGLFRAAPPRHPVFGAASSTPAYLASRFSFSACANAAFEGFRTRWSGLIVPALILFAVSLVAALPQSISAIADASAGRSEPSVTQIFGTCCGFVLNVFVGVPIFYGCVYAASQVLRGEPRVTDAFIGFQRYPQLLLGMLFVGAIYIACTIVSYVPMMAIVALGFTLAGTGGAAVMPWLVGSSVVLVFATLLVLFAIVIMRVFFIPLVAIDPAMGSMGVGRAISCAWNATKGRGWSMTGLILVFGLLAGFSIFLLCIGYILVGIPLFLAMLGAMHEMVNRSLFAAPASGPMAE